MLYVVSPSEYWVTTPPRASPDEADDEKLDPCDDGDETDEELEGLDEEWLDEE